MNEAIRKKQLMRIFKKNTQIKKLLDTLKDAHSKSVDYRKSIQKFSKLGYPPDEKTKNAFDISIRISSILNEVGKIWIEERID